MDNKLRYFRFGVDKMPQWFVKLVGERRVAIRSTKDGVLCCRFTDAHGNKREILHGQVITNDMF